MKHTLKITLLLIFFFFIAQVIGLFIISNYIDYGQTAKTGTIIEKPLPLIERPVVEESTSWFPIFAAILLGTVIALVIIRLKLFAFWKFWFFVSVWFCLTVAFFSFSNLITAVILAFVLTVLKVFRPNIYIHNLSELFIYGGLASIFVFL